MLVQAAALIVSQTTEPRQDMAGVISGSSRDI